MDHAQKNTKNILGNNLHSCKSWFGRVRSSRENSDSGTPTRHASQNETYQLRWLGRNPNLLLLQLNPRRSSCTEGLWALNGDLDGHHHGGEHITHYLFTYYFIYHPYNILLTVKILNSNRLEKLPSITIDMGHAIVRPTDFSLATNCNRPSKTI